ncbi:MAG TPA: hypothetical protein VK427_23505, partial [Kofleriaceae bacterium]|nr:hypothetical protein [Kofleriaceae bacterium]
TRAVILHLARDDYHSSACTFPIAFIERDGHTYVAWAPTWNRLDIVEPWSGQLVTARESPSTDGAHYLDYFHCALSVSNDGRHILDTGWVWHPMGSSAVWSVERWFENVWEAEDGPSLHYICAQELWDGPACWLAGARVAIWGDTDAWLVPSVRIFDADTGVQTGWLPGPDGALVYDGLLYAVGVSGLAAWDVESGTRVFHDASLRDVVYHPDAKTFVSIGDGTSYALVGGEAQWSAGVVGTLARRIADERAFDDLPVLGDALEAAGCADGELLAHCHAPGLHGARCWVIDRLLARG